MNGIRESFLSLDLFSLTFNKYFIAPMDPSLTGLLVRASRIHADNIWLSSRLCLFDFIWFTMENKLSHSYVLPINEQKRSAKSFCFGYFSSETNRQNSSLSRCLFPRMKLSACTSHSSSCYDGDCCSSVNTSVRSTEK